MIKLISNKIFIKYFDCEKRDRFFHVLLMRHGIATKAIYKLIIFMLKGYKYPLLKILLYCKY